ncbi:hypothetical protein SO802_004344 [Lithocarpus litseifolius]|uniref:Uncharacterized protein n=1 Tax=Lithocarpus litseifolius TaxID=425828 RepID=A0AAW2E6L7_9ROSI
MYYSSTFLQVVIVLVHNPLGFGVVVRILVKDYDAALDFELDSMEKFVLQCLAFYQHVILVYVLLPSWLSFSVKDNIASFEL